MTEETIMSSISREERVALVISPHLQNNNIGPNPDCDTQNAAHSYALSVARKVLAALSPDERLIEALETVRSALAGAEDAYRFSGTISVIDAALSTTKAERT